MDETRGAEEPPSHSREGGGEFSDERDPAHRVLVGLSKIGMALRSHAWQEAAPRGLTPTQAQVLVVLGRAPASGLRLSSVASQLGVSAPTVSDSVSTLERKGLVEKSPAVDDARALAITLTEEGARQRDEISEWPDLLLDTVRVLDEEERAVFLRALVKIIRQLQERGRISTSRMCASCRFFRPNVHDDELRPHHCAYVDAPFGDHNLRLDCAEHEPADRDLERRNWRAFTAAP